MLKIYNNLPRGLTHAVFDADQTLYKLSSGFEKEQIITRLYAVLHEELQKEYGQTHLYEETVRIAEEHFAKNYSSITGVANDLGLDLRTLLHTIYSAEHLEYDMLPQCQHTRDSLLLMRNQHRVRLAVLSNGTDLHVHKIIAAMGLDGLFGLIHGVNHHGGYPKPDRRASENTLWELNVKAPKVMLFEDSLRNLKMAQQMAFGYRVYIGEHEAQAPINNEGVFDLWAQTLPEALQAVNQMLAKHG